eukprot:1840961-Pleurochrysis_carterae.AAC.2
MTMDKRGEGDDRGSSAEMSRSSMISAMDSSRRGSRTDARTGTRRVGGDPRTAVSELLGDRSAVEEVTRKR